MRHILASILLPTVAAAQTIVLLPIADATTDSLQPAVNFGSAPTLDCGKVSSSAAHYLRAHLQFDTSPIFGTGLVPIRATLHWYQRQASGAGCLFVWLHAATAPWSENTVTWQNQPPFDPVSATQTCVGDSFANGWHTFHVTSLAQAWCAGTVPDFGIVIRDPFEQTAGASRPSYGWSREHSDPTLQPRLEIEFAVPFGAACTTHAALPSLGVAGGSATMGLPLHLGVEDGLPGAAACAIFGSSMTSWGSVPLPLSLGALGAPNCLLNVEPAVFVTIGLLTSPSTTFPVVFPVMPQFDGAQVFAQVLALTPSGGIEATNGLWFHTHL